MTLPWLTYQRVSTDDQAREGVSLDAQREACRHLASASRYQVSDDIVDPGYSAKNLDRPGMQRVLELVRGRQIAGVIVYKLDRLTRRLRDLLDLIDLFSQHEVALVSVCERLDTGSPMGRFFLSIIGGVAQWERETIAERVQTGMRHRMMQGGYVGGRVPAGLRVVGGPGDRRLEIDPETGPIVAQIWPAIISGRTLRQVAEQLEKAGLACQGKKGWALTAVHRMIQSDRYIGLLVSADDHSRACAVLASRSCPKRRGSAVMPSPKTDRVWILSGIAKCAACGAALVGVSATSSTGKSYAYYRCSGRARRARSGCRAPDLSADRWEPATIAMLQRLVGESGELEAALEAVMRRVRKVSAPIAEERQAKVLELDRLRAEIGRLVTLAASGAVVGQAVAQGLQERQEAAKAVEMQIAGIDGRLAVAEINADQLAAMCAKLRDGLADLHQRSAEDQAAALRLLVTSAILRPDPAQKDRGEIDLAINLPSLVRPEFVSNSTLVDHRPTETNCLRFRRLVSLRLGRRCA